MNIWIIVAVAISVVLISILVFRLHAFLTLLLAGFLVAVLATGEPLAQFVDYQIEKGSLDAAEGAALLSQSASSRLASSFGETAGKIGILIALASIVGGCLLESRAATVIVDRMLAYVGPRRAPEALAVSSFVLGIPVYFDTVFYLMIPLARSLRERVGRDYVLFILAVMAGGSIAHSLVPPTPGPLLVAGIIGVDIGTMMIAGLSIGLFSSVLSLASARVINHFVDVPLRAAEELQGESIAPSRTAEEAAMPMPGLTESLLPIAVPVLLIGIASILDYLVDAGQIETSSFARGLITLGDKNIALAIAVGFAFWLLKYCPSRSKVTLVSRSLGSAGNIILITSAGGAFGVMLRQAGIEEAVGAFAGGVPGLMILPVAFAVTASIRTLQGSATVAMITAAGVLQGLAQAESLPFHPVYLAMAIGAGSKPIAWMTDSGFWIITRMSGMTESEGLKVVSTMSTAMGFSALAVTMIFAAIYPAR
ncbi:Gnt-II system L-idonate transporter [Rubripirellula tenax]|uniref:Gnt-II system L-idonate transporter n=1 Tax=Rubripirellula tenax TaxID=2528015 RepID=A0A5C6E517_9BACT|nr:SLC13 family permease [Rubripirellula tenax]TWU43594.1 Gnt-II system L-idonate transporter [Rubripirellula tenax]